MAASTIPTVLLASAILVAAATYFRHDTRSSSGLTEGPERGSPRVGTAQGFTVRVADRGSVNALSMHLVMEAGEHAGSSLVVSGRVDTDLAVRESVIVGGTGRFRGARGYALSRSFDYDLAKGGVVEIDVYLY
jgi:hypothetical protein